MSIQPSYEGLVDNNQVVQHLLLMTAHGCFRRDDHDWLPLEPGIDDFEDYNAVPATPEFVKLFDSVRDSGGRLVRSDLQY